MPRVDRRLLLAAGAVVLLTAGAVASDFLSGSFWEHHGLVASLLANVLVVAGSVVIINEVLELRDRRRWSLLAQSVLFALIQTARATWTGLVEVLELGEVTGGSPDSLREAAALARDSEHVSPAVRALLSDPERRARLQKLTVRLSEHGSEVIAKWAPVMVGARPYAAVLDRHVELASRLEWLSSVLAHNEPPPGQSRHDRNLTRASVASERAEELGNDEWLHDQIVAVMQLATELDERSREHAYAIVPMSWWEERTEGLARTGAPPELPG